MKPLLTALLFAALTLPLPAVDKPTPQQKAKELLESAAELASAAKPDVQVAVLMHVAENYQTFDRKKALEYFRKAFETAGVPPLANGPFARNTQADIVVKLAAMDKDAAVEMLKQIQAPPEGYDNRSYAAGRVIGVLLQKNDIAAAIALAEYMGGAGAYPFWGVGQIVKKLPAGDQQRTALFSAMLAAYAAKPNREFHTVLMQYRNELPPGMAQSALGKILGNILEGKNTSGINYQTQIFASAKGTASFTNPTEAELFDVMPLVRELDAKQYDELIAKYAELRSALMLFPGGGPSVASDRGAWTFTVGSGPGKPSDPAAEKKSIDALNSRMQVQALITSRSEAALLAADKDPDKALDMVKDIPSPPRQAEVLGRIAESVSENDKAKAAHVLSRCVSLLADVKYPSDRVVPWDLVASAAGAIKDDKLVQQAIDRLLADAADLYKEDSDSDRPNRAWREFWPSTQAYRRAVVRATKLNGVDAEPLLQKITDTDINVLARVMMAQTLLGNPPGDMQTFGGKQHPPQLSAK